MAARSRNLGALAAIVVGIVALLGAALVLLGGGGEAEVGFNVAVNPPGLITANNSPTLARHPDRPEHLVVAHRIDRPGFSALVEWSDDGGMTWTPVTPPLPEDTEACAASPDRTPCPFAPDVAFGPDGTLYVLYVELQGQGNTPVRLWLATSSDGGRTLGPPVQVAGELTFQARLAVAPDGTVHLTWLQAENVGLNRLVGPAPVVASRSADGGQTFTQPVPISDPSRPRVGAATPVVDSNGDLVVLYQDFTGDRRDFENLEGPPATEPFALVVTRSDDGGASFSPGVELESGIVATKRFLVFLPEYPSLAAGPDASLYAAWHGSSNGDDDVFLRRSGDGGSTWSEAVRVNDNPIGDGTHQYLPQVSVAPDGRVDVAFYDRRHDPANAMTDLYLATSGDGGNSFTNLRVSSEPFDAFVGPVFDDTYGADLGTRLGLDSIDDGAFAVWTDTRLGSVDDGRQDIFAAPVAGLGSGGMPLWALGVLAVAVAAVTWLTLRRAGARSGRSP